jgi:hypothetical protein
VCTLHSKKAMNMCIMPRSEHACNVVKLMHNTNTQFNNNFFLQSYKVLCTCVVKQIRTMKRPSSIEYLDALNENKKDKMRVFVCAMHSKKESKTTKNQCVCCVCAPCIQRKQWFVTKCKVQSMNTWLWSCFCKP